MDTLIQLRQPQLSKKPDETALSNALTEALPPLAPELLGDVAEALGQLEEDRRQLEEYQALAKAVEPLRAALSRLRRHAQPPPGAARCARPRPSSTMPAGSATRRRPLLEERSGGGAAPASHEEAELRLQRAQARLDTLRADPTMQDANRLENAREGRRRRAGRR